MGTDGQLARYVYGQEQQRAILETLGLDPRLPETQALIAAAQEYGLDPLMQEIILIPQRGGKGFRPYVTHIGLIAVAHAHPQWDGMETIESRRNSTGDGYTARVSVWRKDMSHPFTKAAQCKDSEPIAKQGYGDVMAETRAERRALRLAFHLRGAAFTEPQGRGEYIDVPNYTSEPNGEPMHVEPIPANVKDRLEAAAADEADADPLEEYGPLSQDLARTAVARAGADARAAFMERWGITDFREPWSPDAIRAALEAPF